MSTRDDDIDSGITLPALPPIDDDEGEGAPSIAGVDEESLLDDDVAEGDKANRDDASADDLLLDPDDDLDDPGLGDEDGGLDVGEDGDDLDFAEEHESLALETLAFDDGDDELEEDDAPTALDDGAEGTSEPIEETVDEAALPDLDDDEPAPDDADLTREILAEIEAPLAPWAASRLAVVDGAGASFPCNTVVAHGGVVVAAGQRLLVVDEGRSLARVAPLSDTIVAVTMADGETIGVTDRGEATALSLDASVASMGSSRASKRVLLSAAGAPVRVVAVSGRLWVVDGATTDGATLGSLSLPLGAREDARLVRDRGMLGIAAAGNTLVALTTGDEGASIERFKGDHEVVTKLTGAGRSIVKGDRGELLLAVADGGASVALARGGHVAISRDGGKTFADRELEDVLAVAFQGDGLDAALLLLTIPLVEEVEPEAARPAQALQAGVSKADSARTGTLLSWSHGGELSRLAELSIDPTRGVGLAWDGSRDVVWVATAAGLVALGAPTRH